VHADPNFVADFGGFGRHDASLADDCMGDRPRCF
jgi:hypothetical protein